MTDGSDFETEDSPEADAPGESSARFDPEQIAFEIEFFEPVLRICPGFVEVLQLLGNHYTRVGRFDDGLAIDRRLVHLCPDDALAHYNLACSLSLTHNPAAAVKELERAAGLGYRDVAHIDRDPDLDNLRHHPDYVSLMRRLRQS